MYSIAPGGLQPQVGLGVHLGDLEVETSSPGCSFEDPDCFLGDTSPQDHSGWGGSWPRLEGCQQHPPSGGPHPRGEAGGELSQQLQAHWGREDSRDPPCPRVFAVLQPWWHLSGVVARIAQQKSPDAQVFSGSSLTLRAGPRELLIAKAISPKSVPPGPCMECPSLPGKSVSQWGSPPRTKVCADGPGRQAG